VKAHQTLALTALIVGCAVPAFAQVPAATSPSSADAPHLRAQVRTMERVFASAVQNGVDQIGRQFNAVMPGVRIFAGMPHAHGYQVEDFGWFFDVEVPEVQTAAAELFVDLQPDPRRRVGSSASTSVVASSVPAVIQDPVREYRLAVRDALIDAMLDYGQLPLKPTEELTVGARAADAPMPSMESSDTVTLILRITGADLALYKQGKLSRAEAKARIKIREDRR
jgi:hypothetical protein